MEAALSGCFKFRSFSNLLADNELMLHRALYVNMRKFQRNILASFSLLLETARLWGESICSVRSIYSTVEQGGFGGGLTFGCAEHCSFLLKEW
jgi:hypothetical protein